MTFESLKIETAIMTYAVQKFAETQPHITSVTQRFSEPGHSYIQDIDNLHSLIEQGGQAGPHRNQREVVMLTPTHRLCTF